MFKVLYQLIILLFIVLTFSFCSEEEKEITEVETSSKPIRYIGSYTRDFKDLNELHLEAAARIGIEPLADREGAKDLNSKLVEVVSGEYCEVEELTYSVPYLVPRAALLLYSIGKNFADSLNSHGAPPYKLVVTSVTRTEEDVKKLGRRNVNASENSAHRYGTTFDISWRRFNKADNSPDSLSEVHLKMLLASVLRDLRKEEKCYIKHEKKQSCFHITAR